MLRTAVLAALPQWLERQVRARVPDAALDADRLSLVVDTVTRGVADRLDRLVAADVNEPHSGPLECIRQSLAPLTEHLTELGVARPERDPFDMRARPDDVYSLGPMSFEELSAEVHRAGIEWGAAKAFVHKQRNTSSEPDSD